MFNFLFFGFGFLKITAFWAFLFLENSTNFWKILRKLWKILRIFGKFHEKVGKFYRFLENSTDLGVH